MCLHLEEGAKLQIATEDITVYKRVIKYHDITKLKSGMAFKSVINGIECEGKISVEDNRIYFCTNDKRLNGAACRDKQGYKYSWVIGCDVDLSETTIDGKPVSMYYKTPYQEMPIKIGETYHSRLNKIGNAVDEGLHSFASAKNAKEDGPGSVVECIIPKGSQYYIGTFNGDISYASDCIKYVEII